MIDRVEAVMLISRIKRAARGEVLELCELAEKMLLELNRQSSAVLDRDPIIDQQFKRPMKAKKKC